MVRGALPGPRARAIIRRTSRVISPSIARDDPLVVESAHGAVVTDVDGNRFIDFSSGIAVLSTGSTHPKVVAAAKRQLDRFIHFSYTDFYYENLVTLAEKLCELAPGDGAKKVYWGNSGAEANEAAMKLARNYTKRPLFLAHSGAFHGRTMGALSLTASKPIQRKGAFPIPILLSLPVEADLPRMRLLLRRLLQGAVSGEVRPCRGFSRLLLRAFPRRGGIRHPAAGVLQEDGLPAEGGRPVRRRRGADWDW
jgi:4-aminobutyrate aminotransferase-like enzyme